MKFVEAWKVYGIYARIAESVAWLNFEVIKAMGIDNYKDKGIYVHARKVRDAVSALKDEVSGVLDKEFENARLQEEGQQKQKDG